jgi:diguanylate cyclase (GGDEF)-like protein
MTEKQTFQLTSHTQSGQSEAPAGLAPQSRVLIADDDAHIRQLLEMALGDDGFEVLSAADGYELVQLAQERGPNLILVDLSMPRMDGYEAIRQMRNDTRTAHIPMLILTARSGIKDIVTGFETGADDYIAKPFDINELLARVRSHLRRSAQRPVLNPLTGMPGGVLLSQELRHRLGRDQALALLYADLDNFKAFNDIYGFSRGDQAIIFVAGIIQRVVAEQGNSDDFIGHIGGDDFAMLTSPERIDRICRTLIATFDEEIRHLYNAEDRERGYITSADRYGILRRFSLMTISIGVVTNERRRFGDEESLTRVAAEMKRYAKEQGGSTYAVDQRGTEGWQEGQPQGAVSDRRGQRARGVLIASADTSLRAVLRSTLRESGYTTNEAPSIESLRQRIAAEQPAVVLADAQFGAPLWDLCAELADSPRGPDIVVLAYQDDDLASAHGPGGIVNLHLPLPLADIVACIDNVTRRGAFSDDALTNRRS